MGIIYRKENITVSTIEEDDVDKVLEYFVNNSFNCDFESGALKPTPQEERKIIESVIRKEDDENAYLVLKKDNIVIGYIAMWVEYQLLHIGHIAIDLNEQHQGYGELLTRIAIKIAENEDRDVRLYCNHNNKYLIKIGFKTNNGIHYSYKTQRIKHPSLPKLFVTIEEYRIRKRNEEKKSLQQFESTLKWIKEMEIDL